MGLEILLIVVIAIAGMIVQGRLQKVFDKYSRVMFHGGLTGREVAEKTSPTRYTTATAWRQQQ